MALSADTIISTKQQDTPTGGVVMTYDMGSAAKVYKGSFVRLGTNGITPCAGTSVEPCLGMALEQVDNTAGAGGAKTCEVLVGANIVHDVGTTTVANIGDAVYASADDTLTLDSSTNEFVGFIVNFISGDSCVVKMAGLECNRPS